MSNIKITDVSQQLPDMPNKITGFQEVLISEVEAETIAQVEKILSGKNSQLKLIGSNGEEAIVPESVYPMLRQVLGAIASGKGISLFPHNCELTLQQAANILNVSPKFLFSLLEAGEIPYIEAGDRLQIRLEDLMVYREKRDKKRANLLDKLIDLSQEAGFYQK
jgi:excisionase family DNA binding protein